MACLNPSADGKLSPPISDELCLGESSAQRRGTRHTHLLALSPVARRRWGCCASMVVRMTIAAVPPCDSHNPSLIRNFFIQI